MTPKRLFESLDRRVRDARGFTLLELLIGMSLLVVVLGFTYEFLMTGQRAALTTRDSFQAQSQLRAALDSMVDEMRWAQSITAANGTSITLGVPGGTPFSGTAYSVRFAYDAVGKTITRQQNGGAIEPIAYSIAQLDGSAGLTIDYYDGSSTQLTLPIGDLTAIARVRLTVTSTKNNTSRTFVGDAALRGK